MKRIACILIFVAILCGSGCAKPDAQTVQPPTFKSFSSELNQAIKSKTDDLTECLLNVGFQSGIRSYALSRVIEITPEQREPATFGPWTAPKDYLIDDARDDGSLSEWYDNYYITHQWSEYGAQILSLIPGDTVQVNGHTVQIEGIFNYPKDSYYDEIMALVGDDSVVFQTCYPDSDENRIAWGHYTVL